MTDSVGIIGAGRLGQAMVRTALRAGRRVVIANSRGPESLASVVSELGDLVSAGTVEQAAAAGIVVIAVPWDRVPQAVQGLDWNGQVVIDATNDWAADDLNGRTSSDLVAELVPGARVVKAANTLGADVLGSDPEQAGGPARALHLRRRRRRQGSRRFAVRRRRVRGDRPRQPRDRRRTAGDPPPARRPQPDPTLRRRRLTRRSTLPMEASRRTSRGCRWIRKPTGYSSASTEHRLAMTVHSDQRIRRLSGRAGPRPAPGHCTVPCTSRAA